MDFYFNEQKIVKEVHIYRDKFSVYVFFSPPMLWRNFVFQIETKYFCLSYVFKFTLCFFFESECNNYVEWHNYLFFISLCLNTDKLTQTSLVTHLLTDTLSYRQVNTDNLIQTSLVTHLLTQTGSVTHYYNITRINIFPGIILICWHSG